MKWLSKILTPEGYRRWLRFKAIKRAYYSLVIIFVLYLLSFFLPLLVNRDALLVKYNGKFYFPLFTYYKGEDFNQYVKTSTDSIAQPLFGEANYRLLKKEFANDNSDNWVLLPIVPYDPEENLLDELEGVPPHPPSGHHWLGTDDRGRDVFARLAYGFKISLTFSLLVTLVSFIIGVIIGGVLGFVGGKTDLIGVRLIEIWSTLPFLYIIIIISSFMGASFLVMIIILTLFNWMNISFYVRGEFYREKVKEYVLAARSIGVSSRRIIFRHILPNSLTPIITFIPFSVVGNITLLVALDYLGFGLPPPTPSWGELVNQGMHNLHNWWLVVFPLMALFLTLLLIVFIGEGVREAFNPREKIVFQ
ncbi:MAG: ABC transporter permease subunit [Ignavibacteria bacterium]